MRSPTIPHDAEVICTFDQLREFRDSFFRGELSFLVLVGRPGLSKSWEFKDQCRPRRGSDGTEFVVAHYVRGNVTAARAYRIAYEHRNKLLVLDDAERIWRDPHGRFLLRDLTEGTAEKRVSWQVNNKDFERDGIPQSFHTTSRVCLIMNRFVFGVDEEYDAIIDRAHFVYFDPAPLEIHKNAALWFWDQQVYDFIGRHLPIIDHGKLSSRTYTKAYERKSKGDWQEFISRRCFSQSNERWVRALEQDPQYTTVADRVAEFKRRTGCSRATYFSIKKALGVDCKRGAGEVPTYQRRRLQTPRAKRRQQPKGGSAKPSGGASRTRRSGNTAIWSSATSRMTKRTMTRRRVSDRVPFRWTLDFSDGSPKSRIIGWNRSGLQFGRRAHPEGEGPTGQDNPVLPAFSRSNRGPRPIHVWDPVFSAPPIRDGH